MTSFKLYFDLGKDHILDFVNGYDHILFVVALCALYHLRDWRKVLVLVTAFTVGHSITLALSVFHIINVKAEWVEFFIPMTIFITGVSNLFKDEENLGDRVLQLNYFYALFFGLVHGLGFSNYLRGILGRDRSIITQLFAFNIGLELGQIIIVVLFLVLSFIATNIFSVTHRDWKLVISSAIAGVALILMKDHIFW